MLVAVDVGLRVDTPKSHKVMRPDGRWHRHRDPLLLAKPFDPAEIARRLRAAASRIVVPALLVRGRRSQMMDDAGTATSRGIVPQFRVVDIASASHMATGDDNDGFAGRLRLSPGLRERKGMK